MSDELIAAMKLMGEMLDVEPYWSPEQALRLNTWTARDELRYRLNKRLKGEDPGPPAWGDFR